MRCPFREKYGEHAVGIRIVDGMVTTVDRDKVDVCLNCPLDKCVEKNNKNV